MTIVFDMGEFWIESFFTVGQVVGSGAVVNDDVNLTRPGNVVGASAVISAENLTAAFISVMQVQLNIGGTNNRLTYGVPISQIRIKLSNNHPTTGSNLAAYVILLMRK